MLTGLQVHQKQVPLQDKEEDLAFAAAIFA